MLKAQLEEAARQAPKQAQIVPPERVVERGFYIEFESDPGYDLKVESLKNDRQGIKLVAVSEVAQFEQGEKLIRATVFVPEGKLDYFINKVEQYLAKDTKTRKPRNRELVESVANIRIWMPTIRLGVKPIIMATARNWRGLGFMAI